MKRILIFILLFCLFSCSKHLTMSELNTIYLKEKEDLISSQKEIESNYSKLDSIFNYEISKYAYHVNNKTFDNDKIISIFEKTNNFLKKNSDYEIQVKSKNCIFFFLLSSNGHFSWEKGVIVYYTGEKKILESLIKENSNDSILTLIELSPNWFAVIFSQSLD